MLPELPVRWRELAATLEPFAAPAAEAYRRAARELEEAMHAATVEPITPAQAEAEGICDAETVRRAVREGRASNVGTPGKIMVPRAQVPRGRKARRSSFEEIARSAVRNSPRR